MARGYLGKISAVISANTGDYVRKLNESAKETRAFASTVQKSLARASGDASKSLEGIFTPLQKVERALRAAASQKLAFRGFDGAIRDVQSLQAAIAKLTDQKTIDLVVKTSGVGSLEELKRTINVLRNQDVTVGVEGLRQQRAAQQAAGANFIGPVTLQVKQEGDRLDAVIEALERIDAERIKQISLQVESQQLDAAALKLRQLVSAGREIGAPLAAAAKQYDSLSLSVQTAFGPALKRAQQAAESLSVAIDSGATISQRKFAALRRDVDLTAAAIKRLAEAEAIIGRLGDGRSLRDVAPRQFDAINEAGRIQQRSDALSGQAAAGFGVGRQEAAVRRQLQILNQMRAKQEQVRRDGGDTSSIDIAIERQTDRLEKQLAVWDRLVKAAERYKTAASGAQDADTARLINRERAALEAERNRTPSPTRGEQDDTARLINRERAALEAERQRISDEQLRAQAAGRFLQVDQRESNLISNRGLATQLGPRRFTNQIGQDIQSLRTQIRDLGDVPLAASLGQQVDTLSNQFGVLDRDVAKTRTQLEQLNQVRIDTRSIRDAISSRRELASSFASAGGGRGAAGLDVGIDQRSLRAAGSEIEFLQGRLSNLSLEARGPAVAALDQYRLAVARAFRDGSISTEAGKKSLEAYRNELVRVASRLTGISPKKLAADLKRVGDVARGSFGNAGLAVQQAAFAFEDFFSVTGGLDQRIRAAGNNISQLGFILGGTTGLIVGISTAIGAQLVASLIKWYNEGRTAEDQTKALTQAIERQKSVVDELAQSYQKVADAIKDAGLSGRGRQDAGIRRQVEEIQKQQRQAREGRIQAVDIETAKARADVSRAERELGSATSPQQQVRAQLQLNAARERQRQAEQTAVERAGKTAGVFREDAIAALTRDIQREREAATRGLRIGGGGELDIGLGAREQLARERSRAFDQQIADLKNIGTSPSDVLKALDDRLKKLVGEGASGDILLPLEQIRESLLVQSRQLQADDFASKITDSGLRAARSLDEAQENIRAAFGESRNVGGLDNAIALLSSRITKLASEGAAAAQGGRLEEVQAINAKIEAARQEAAQINLASEAARRFAEALNRASQEAQANLSSAQQAADQARAAYLGFSTPARRTSRQQAERDLQAQRELASRVEQERAAAQERFSAATVQEQDRQRRRDLAQEARSNAARGIAIEQQSGLGNVEGEGWQGLAERLRASGGEAERAASEVERIADRQAEIANQLGLSNEDFWNGVYDALDSQPTAAQEVVDIVREISQIDSQLQSTGVLAAGQREQLASRRAQLEQQFVESDAGVRAAVDASTREEQRRQSAARGAELRLRPGERAGRELGQQLNDLGNDVAASIANAVRDGRFGDIPGIQQRAEQDRQRIREDAMRQQAPAIFGLADAVTNALLQGPSRAALQPTDVSTVEGSRELTRLLRGDDAAKDQANLVELQKEANRLLDMIANNPANIAN